VVDLGLSANFQASIDLWSLYPNTAFFQGTRTTNEMSQEDTAAVTAIHTKALEYMYKNAANFITGKSNFDKDWDKWCTILKKYKVDEASKTYQYYVDNYPFR